MRQHAENPRRICLFRCRGQKIKNDETKQSERNDPWRETEKESLAD